MRRLTVDVNNTILNFEKFAVIPQKKTSKESKLTQIIEFKFRVLDTSNFYLHNK